MALFAWLAFLLYPPVGAVLAVFGLWRAPRRRMPYVLILALLLAIAAYYYNPTPEQDLYRYLQQVRNYMQVPWLVFLYRMEDVGQLLFYLVSRTGLPHLLPAIAAFVVYTIALYMVCDYTGRSGAGRRWMLLAMLFTVCVMSFPIVISVLRNSMAFAIAALAAYRDLYRRKRGPLTWVLYLLPIFIHVAAVTCILLRLVCAFVQNRRWLATAVSGGFLLIWVFLESLLRWLIGLPAVMGNSLLRGYLGKAYNYVAVTENLSGYVAYVRGSVYMTVLRIYHLVVLLLLLYCAWRLFFGAAQPLWRQAGAGGDRPLLVYVALLVGLTLGLLPIPNPFYSRFFYMAVMFGFVLLEAYRRAMQGKTETQWVGLAAALCAGGGALNQVLLVAVQADGFYIAGSVLTSGLVGQLVRALAA